MRAPTTAFDRWMHRVDVEVRRRSGVSVHDLADYAFRDAFLDEMSPAAVAEDALADNGFPSGDDDEPV